MKRLQIEFILIFLHFAKNNLPKKDVVCHIYWVFKDYSLISNWKLRIV
jgi:hypothetical protein